MWGQKVSGGIHWRRKRSLHAESLNQILLAVSLCECTICRLRALKAALNDIFIQTCKETNAQRQSRCSHWQKHWQLSPSLQLYRVCCCSCFAHCFGICQNAKKLESNGMMWRKGKCFKVTAVRSTISSRELVLGSFFPSSGEKTKNNATLRLLHSPNGQRKKEKRNKKMKLWH